MLSLLNEQAHRIQLGLADCCAAVMGGVPTLVANAGGRSPRGGRLALNATYL